MSKFYTVEGYINQRVRWVVCADSEEEALAEIKESDSTDITFEYVEGDWNDWDTELEVVKVEEDNAVQD